MWIWFVPIPTCSQMVDIDAVEDSDEKDALEDFADADPITDIYKYASKLACK